MPELDRSESWKALEEIFYRALEIEPERQAQFLEAACGGDPALRAEVQSLLDAAGKSADFLSNPLETAARELFQRENPATLRPGCEFDHYRIVSLAGAGGMGLIYLAEDTRLDRKVAIKTLAPDLIRDTRSLQRFEQEARAASALNHPNILTIYEVGECEGTHFIAAEFIEGPTLRKRLTEGKMEVAQVLDIAAQIASGLGAAHDTGIVHCDVKPENILLRQDGLAKLVDFGIARLTEESGARRRSASITKTGMRMGTTKYMSPEQARGLRLDARTDIFSLGTVIYEMLPGKEPFEGATDSDVVAEILKTDPPPLDVVLPEIPAELARIVARAMCKDREGRYCNARDLYVELKAVQQELEFRAKLEITLPSLFAASSPRREPFLTRRVVLTALAAATLLTVAYEAWKQPAISPFANRPRSLAILPFRNIGPDSAADFLGFSLADAIITKLGYVSSLSVRPSSAVEHYRHQTIDLRQAGAALNVDTLLMGSYEKEGDDLRITAQLIDVKPMNILWRDTIDVRYDKLLTVDDRVAERIISGLELSLTPSESAHLKSDKPRPEAYESYLRGVDLYALNDFESAIAMLEKSALIDPGYALTWSHLGQAYEANASLQFGGRQQYQKALEAYRRALQLNPALIEARVNMANFLIDTGRVEEAVPLLRAALESNRNSAGAHWELGYAYRFAGLLQDSVRECELARQIDPSVKLTSSAINAYFYLGQYDKWLASLPASNSAYILFYRGLGQYYTHDYTGAAADFDRAFETNPGLMQAAVGKAISDSIARNPSAGRQLLRQTEAKIQERGVTDAEGIYKVAQAYAVLGDTRSALRVLRQSIQGGFFCYPYFQTDPLLDSLRREPDFTALVKRAQLRHEQFEERFSPARAAGSHPASGGTADQRRKVDHQRTIMRLGKTSVFPKIEMWMPR
jgi:serine/threonine protein kinase